MSASIARHCSYEIHPPSKSEEEMSPALTRQTVSLTRNVAELVAAHAAAAPKAIAITDDGRVMTYGELDERANRLANYLIELGVGPEAIVGLCLDRSLRSEEHTSELQSRGHLVCRLLLEKKKKKEMHHLI